MQQIPNLTEERVKPRTPEAELWLAVVDQAIGDLSDLDLREATIEWFTSHSEEPGSFRWICEQLDLNASAVWGALKKPEIRKRPAKSHTRTTSSKAIKPEERRLPTRYSHHENSKGFTARL